VKEPLNPNYLGFRSQEDYVSKYRRVLEYFDAVKIGLTATPALHTVDPTFARFPRFRGQDRSFDRLGQRQIVLSASKGRLKPAVDSTGTVKRPDLARSRHTFAVVACRI
jgi:hypothetical protein